MDDRGAVAVEYALCLPYLLAFIYGIVEISHFAFLRTTVANVARDAVRYAIVHSSISAQPLGATDISSYANSELTSLGLASAGNGVTVTYSPDNSPGSTVQVQISYPFTPFMPGLATIASASSSFTGFTGPIVGNAKMVMNP
jgi:Flp pilus assembly protein TadG